MEVWTLECGDETAGGVLGIYSSKAQAITAAEQLCPPGLACRWDWNLEETQGLLCTPDDSLVLIVEPVMVDAPPDEGWRLFFANFYAEET
jgi:hypothetical protein